MFVYPFSLECVCVPISFAIVFLFFTNSAPKSRQASLIRRRFWVEIEGKRRSFQVRRFLRRESWCCRSPYGALPHPLQWRNPRCLPWIARRSRRRPRRLRSQEQTANTHRSFFLRPSMQCPTRRRVLPRVFTERKARGATPWRLCPPNYFLCCLGILISHHDCAAARLLHCAAILLPVVSPVPRRRSVFPSHAVASCRGLTRGGQW